MVAEQDQLSVIAEVAVALAGFASLMALIGSRSSEGNRRFNRERLMSSLVEALSTTAFALLPIVVGNFIDDTATLWRVSAAFWLAALLPYRFFTVRAASRSGYWAGARAIRFVLSSSLVLSSLALYLSVLFNMVGSHASAAYVLALYIGLITAGVLFLWFAIALLEGLAPDA